MDFLEKVLEQLKSLAGKIIDILLGPDAEPELDMIPIPVRDRNYPH